MQFVSTPQESTEQWPYLPTDTYRMKIVDAKQVTSKFVDERTNEPKQQIEIDWEVTHVSEDQADAGAKVGHRLKQWVSTYAGYLRGGGMSKLGEIVKPSFDSGELSGEFEAEDLVGMERRVSVGLQEHKDQNGITQYRNPILAVTAARPGKPAITGKVNLDDADDIVPQNQTRTLEPGQIEYFQQTYAILGELNNAELTQLAEQLRPFSGPVWKRKIWQNAGDESLRTDIDKMWQAAVRLYPALAENENLF